MLTDFADLQITDTIEATCGTEFVRVQTRDRKQERYVLHRLVPGASPLGRAVLHRARHVTETYQLRCMLRFLGQIETQNDLTLVYEDVPFQGPQRWKGTALSLAIQRAIDMVKVLGEVHTAGLILHCVRPSSFLFTDVGVKFLDFGQATSSKSQIPEMSPLLPAVDLHYIAPEQTGRINRGIDYRADFYALGVVLYEMFTGAKPFQADDPLELVYQHLTKTPLGMRELQPLIPVFLSDIVQKLLSKEPARRYQSVEGILADLELIRNHGGDDAVPEQSLGHLDIPYNLHSAPRLYGRANERASLVAAYERACEGLREMVYVSGRAGIGKTALIKETFVPITPQPSYFISGKFEQLERRVPYAAWLGALDSLLVNVLSEPESVLVEIQHRVDTALGPNAGVLIEVLPNLQTLLGRKSPPTTLLPRDAQERFVHVFCSFIASFCAPGRPLVIFLDDWQWADAASLSLLERIATDPLCRHVFLIVAARDEELSPSHGFRRALDNIRAAQISTTTLIQLAPLRRSDLTQIVADMFRLPAEEATPLAAVLAAKSGGNPFFAWQFLRLLRVQNLVRFSPLRMRWIWDLHEISAVGHSEDVVELMLHRLHQLPDTTRSALSLAACLGTHFGLARLTKLVNSLSSADHGVPKTIDALQTVLGPALSEELLIAIGTPDIIDGMPVALTMCFSHDRVQEAAYKLLDPDQVIAVHHRIARLLIDGATETQINENIFEITDHLNSAHTRISTRDERIEHARFNLLAAARAAESAAFESALHYARSAMSLVPEDLGRTDPALARSLYQARGEFEYLHGNFDLAKKYVCDAIELASDLHTKANLHKVLVTQYTLRATYNEAISAGRAGLALLSMHLPADDLLGARDAELAAVAELLDARPLRTLGQLPPMTNQTQQAVMNLLLAMGPPCYRSHPRLWSLIVATEMRQCLEHGASPGVTYTFPAYGGLRQYLGQGSATECSDLHAATCAILPGLSQGVEVSIGYLMMGSSLDHWFASLAHASLDYRKAYSVGIESGNLQYAAYALGHDAYCRFYQGLPLKKLIQEIEASHEFCTKRKNFWGMDITSGVLRIARALSSDTETNDSEEEDYLLRCGEHGNVQVLGIYHTLAAEMHVHRGHLEAAAQSLRQAADYLDCFATQGLLPSTQYHFLHGFLLVNVPHCFDVSADEALTLAIEKLQRLQRWAHDCPANFLHMAALLAAEVAIKQGADTASIEDHFDTALSSALQERLFSRAGLAAARATLWWERRRKISIADMYRAKARGAYRAWQATQTLPETPKDAATSNDLDVAEPISTASIRPSSPLTNSSSSLAEDLDLQGILRTAQAVAKSTELADVILSVIENVAKVSGAQRTLLLLPHHHGLMHIWEAQETPEASARSTPLEGFDKIPQTVIQYVRRTLKTIRVDEQDNHVLMVDPYLQTVRPASVVCVPILLTQELHGILYLEHREIAGAFDAKRLQLIEFLAATAAAAVRNANLVRQLRNDIALRMEAEAKLKEREREQRLLIEQSPLGMQVFSADGRQIQTNLAFEDLWGFHAEKPQTIQEHPLLTRYPGAIRQLSEGGVLDLGDHCIQEASSQSTHERWVNGRAYGVKGHSGTLERIVVSLQDITDRKRVEELKSQFVSTVSHELRTPITSIRGSLALIMGGILGIISPEVSELVQIALSNSERLARIVDDILDFEKIERGLLVLHLEDIDVLDVLQRAVESNRGFAMQHDVTLTLDAPATIPRLQIHADVDRVVQVLTNLISNAVKFSPPQGHVRLRLVQPKPSIARVEVLDAGCGVPSNFRSKLFQRFTQADGSDSRLHGGTGLGLSITRELVGRMNGSVGYEPIHPVGSCFYVEFPIVG